MYYVTYNMLYVTYTYICILLSYNIIYNFIYVLCTCTISVDIVYAFTLVVVIAFNKDNFFFIGLTNNQKKLWNYFHLMELHHIFHSVTHLLISL